MRFPRHHALMSTPVAPAPVEVKSVTFSNMEYTCVEDLIPPRSHVMTKDTHVKFNSHRVN